MVKQNVNTSMDNYMLHFMDAVEEPILFGSPYDWYRGIFLPWDPGGFLTISLDRPKRWETYLYHALDIAEPAGGSRGQGKDQLI